MLCKNCGTELAEDAKFCVSCGTAVTAEVEQAPAAVEQPAAPVEAPAAEASAAEAAAEVAQKKENPLKPMLEKLKPSLEQVKPFVQKNKLMLTGVAGVLLLVIAIGLIGSLFAGGNGFIEFENAMTAMVHDDEIMLLINDKLVKTGIEADSIENQSLNIDGTILTFLTGDDELYVVKGKKAVKVAEDVISFTMSVEGSGIAYLSGDHDDCSLNLYNVNKKKSTTVIDECSSLTMSYYSYALSPDGKSLAYYEFDEEEFEATLMYFNGKKSIKITSSEVDLLGISNGGKYIYVLAENDDGDDVLYTYNKKGDRDKIGDCSNSYVYFNADHTQILYLNDGKTYLSINGKEGSKFASGRASLLIAPNANGNDRTYPVDDLYDHVYIIYDDGEYNAWNLQKKLEKSEKLVSDIYDARLDVSCKYLYYINDDSELCVLKVSQGDRAADRAKILAEDVDGYVVTSDAKKVYFVSDESLYSCKGKNGKSKKTIARDDVDSTLAINAKDVVYYEMDGDCYACSNGKKGTKVLSDVSGIMEFPNGVLYIGSDDALYVTDGAKKLSKLMDID